MSDSEDWNFAKSKRKHTNKQKLQRSNVRGRKPRQEIQAATEVQNDVTTNSSDTENSESSSDIRKIDIALAIAEQCKSRAMHNFTPYLQCGVCKGYLIGAVTIRDCIHSFCRSCIYQFVQKEQHCPTCVALESDKEHPVLKHTSIQYDSALQSLVFKMVPGLFANELQRVEMFYKSKGILDPPREYPEFLSPDDTLSLSIEYFKVKEEEENGFQYDLSRRFLQCPAAVTIGHLTKLIKLKYELNSSFGVDIIYNNEILIETLTLMDVVYIHQWQREEPMAFYYRIYNARIPPLQIKIVKTSPIVVKTELESPPLITPDNSSELKVEPGYLDEDLPLSEAIKKVLPVIPTTSNKIITNIPPLKVTKPNYEVQIMKPTKMLKVEVPKLNMNKSVHHPTRSVLKPKDAPIKQKNNVKLKQESIRPVSKSPLKSLSSKESASVHFSKSSERSELHNVPVKNDDKFVKPLKDERTEKIKEKIDIPDVYKFTNEKVKEKEKYKYGRDKDKYKDKYTERKLEIASADKKQSETVSPVPNMQPRVDLTEYARNIGLTAVKNTAAQFSYNEKDTDREHYEFARKRDREWAQQKYLDEKLHKHESHKRKKKAKHIKNEESKRPKLHAEITSPESGEDLKLKVKLTTCKHKHHKHHSDHSNSKSSASPVPSTSFAPLPSISSPPALPIKKDATPLSMPIIPNVPSSNIEPSSKERLLQMRQVRKDKNLNTTLTTSTKTTTPSSVSEITIPTEQRRTDIPNLIPAQDIINGFSGFKQNIVGKINDSVSKSNGSIMNKPPQLTQRPIVNQNGKRPPSDDISNPHKLQKMENKMHVYNPRSIPDPPRKQLPIILPPASISVTKMAEGQTSPPPIKPLEKRPNLEIMLISSPERDNGNARPATPRTPQTISLLKIKNSAEAANGIKKQPIKIEKPGAHEVTIHVEIPTATKNPVCDNIGALDLSGKSTRSPNSESCSSPEQMPKPGPPKLNRIPSSNGVPNHVKKLDSDKSENPMSNLEMLSESAVQLMNSEQRVPPIRHGASNMNLQKLSSTLRIPMPPRQAFKPGTPSLQRTVPRLNEIRGTRPINARPQNQTVRSIPNPSALSFRQNQISRPVTSDNAKTGNSQNAAFPHRSPTASQQPDGCMSPKALEPPTDIKKMETIAKNIHIEKVTAGLAVRASEANGKIVNPILKARCARALHIGGAPMLYSSSGELL